MKKDYYEILGVAKGSTAAEIKAAYRKKALESHPDRNKSADATEKFKEINKAFEVLSDPKKKEMYDQFGHDAFERSGGNSAAGGNRYQQQGGPFSYSYSSNGENPFGDNVDPFEIFEQFFGFRSPFSGSQSRRPQRALYQVHISFEDAVKGGDKEFKIEGKNKKIKIPAGVDDGMRIRFADFDLLVSVAPHQFFKREGQDIYYEKEISYPLAILGGIVEVPTIDSSVKLKVRNGTQSGTTVRLRGQGVPYPNTKQKGDQYVIFKIHVPEKVSNKAKKHLEELQKEL